MTYTTMPAAAQRARFGYPVFGRMRFARDPHRGVWIVRLSTDYGRDWNIQIVRDAEVAHAAHEQRRVRVQR
jgi:hypothetical protein